MQAKKYFKEIRGGKKVYRMPDAKGEPGREVETADSEIGDYIESCLMPLGDCIKTMAMELGTGEADALSRYLNMLERLYDSTRLQLEQMDGAIYKDLGWIHITTTNEDVRGGFLQQDFIEVYVKEEPKKAVSEG